MPDLLDDELIFEKVRDISAGQYSYPFPTDDVIIPKNAGVELLDLEIDQIGQRSKRKGYTLKADDLGTVAIHGLFGYSPSGGTRVLLTETNGAIYSWDGAAATWTSRQTGLTAPADWTEFVAAAVGAVSRVFRLGPTDNIRSSTDGVTWVDEGNLNTNFPLAKIGLWTSIQRMLAANTTDEPNGLFYSNAGDPRTWDRGANFFRIGRPDVRGIMGLIEWTNLNVMAWTYEEMHFLDISNATPGNWQRQKVADIGCTAPRSVRLIGEDGLFLARDGVRSVLQSAQDKKRGVSPPISFPIQDWIDRINWANAHKAVAWVWADKYFLAVPIDDSTVNSHILVWSRKAFEANGGRGGWVIWRIKANAFATQDFSSKPRLYHGEATADSKVYELRSSNPADDATSDNGTAISFSETGRRMDHEAPEVDKTYESIEVEAIAQNTGSLLVEAQVDGGGFSTVGTISLLSGAPTLPVTLPFTLVGAALVRQKFNLEGLGRGRDIQVRLTETTLDADVTVLGYTVAAFAEDYEAG
jgi:hypothetical protein